VEEQPCADVSSPGDAGAEWVHSLVVTVGKCFWFPLSHLLFLQHLLL